MLSADNCRNCRTAKRLDNTPQATRYTATMAFKGDIGIRSIRIGVLDNDACALNYIMLMLKQLNNRNGMTLNPWTTTFPARALQECQHGMRHTDILLLDMALNGINGPQVAKSIRRISPTTAIIGMTSYEPELYQAEASKAGITTILDKTTLADNLPKAIVDALAAPQESMESEYESSSAQTPLPKLTDAEQRILTLSASGLNAKQIATRLGISTDTVFSHRRNIKTKFHVSDWHDVIAQSRQLHII